MPAPDTPAPTPIPADALARAGLVDRTPRRSRVAEEFRIVRSKVLRAAFGGNGVAASPRGNLILVTSALAGEGKTFVATNLAAGLSRQGDRRVLLVDIDLKDDALSRLIGVSTAPGMLDLARTSHHRVEEFVIPTALENLDVLPLGTGVAESAELFASKRMAERLDDLSRRYADRPIIFDASPCLSNSIPHVIAPLVGQIIMVVAAGSTQQGDIEAALDMVQGCPNVSLLLNKMMPWNRRSFGAYAYGYSSSA
ncbi:MAG TPA: AAA family ATPase [Stellaceae bacterium]|nr:AAA family ATPase [Stellaceae bacterium]